MVTISPALRPSVTQKRMVLDVGSIRRAFFILGLFLVLISPFSPDPLAVAVGGFVPWVLLSIAGLPFIPVAAIFYFVWQWSQVFAQALVSMLDGQSMSSSGAGILTAYWYSLASLIVLSIAFRLVFSGQRGPSPAEENAHLEWRPLDLFLLYCGTLVLAIACAYASRLIPGLSQQLEAVSRLKIVAEFLLFVTVLGTGRGNKFLLAAVVFEIVIGFSGLLSDFRGVFVYLAMAAIAARIVLRATSIIGSVVWFSLLMTLALFWTAVKTEYREYATGGEETQHFSIPIEDRLAYIGNLALSADNIDWGMSAYALLNRFAYIDIFGTVMSYQDASREAVPMRQWQDALGHVFKPRFFFPDKAALSDTETYARLAGLDPALVLRDTTSISVGFIAENYVDLGFPGMLAGIFVLGMMLAGSLRYFMGARHLPWMVKQGIALALVYNVAGVGIEASLPKLFGSIIMFFLVYLLLTKFVLPIGLQWLHARAGAEPAQTS
ncbi:MAG: hypothetical protein PSV46_08565 [Reyranella sp.]|nr:hypothetical protein [Reyranella sp.]